MGGLWEIRGVYVQFRQFQTDSLYMQVRLPGSWSKKVSLCKAKIRCNNFNYLQNYAVENFTY